VIADDDEATLRLYRLLLEQAGMTVHATRNGLEALRLVIDHEPDLLVTDVRLPLVSGLELVRRIRNHPHLKQSAILVVTALATDECRRRSEDAGCDRFLLKPTPVLDFLEAVRGCLAQESEGRRRA
jgi:CheY-like chemotaxis protein